MQRDLQPISRGRSLLLSPPVTGPQTDLIHLLVPEQIGSESVPLFLPLNAGGTFSGENANDIKDGEK